MQLHRLNYAFIKRLKKTVYGYSKIIYGDLDKAIKVGLNYLAALGLSTYSEVLGGLCYGNLLSNHNANYDRFIKILVIQSVLPLMRRQRDGTIVNIGSIGGRIAFPFSPFYASTKFAMEGLSEALRYEVAQFGIKVILVEPGLIKTNFFENVKKPKRTEDSPYH